MIMHVDVSVTDREKDKFKGAGPIRGGTLEVVL